MIGSIQLSDCCIVVACGAHFRRSRADDSEWGLSATTDGANSRRPDVEKMAKKLLPTKKKLKNKVK
jgi:hypothetical protein